MAEKEFKPDTNPHIGSNIDGQAKLDLSRWLMGNGADGADNVTRSEIPQSMFMDFVMMAVEGVALDPTNTEPLDEVFQEKFLLFAQALNRKRVNEALQMMAIATEKEEERAVDDAFRD